MKPIQQREEMCRDDSMKKKDVQIRDMGIRDVTIGEIKDLGIQDVTITKIKDLGIQDVTITKPVLGKFVSRKRCLDEVKDMNEEVIVPKKRNKRDIKAKKNRIYWKMKNEQKLAKCKSEEKGLMQVRLH